MNVPRAVGLLADSISDAGSTRTVYLLAAGLALLGVALLAITVSFWKSSKPEPPLLAPLEVMEQKKFRGMGRMEQRRLLDSVRPMDAQPVNRSVVVGVPVAHPELDLRAMGRSAPVGMDDLIEPVPVPPLQAPVADETSNEGVAIDPLLRMFDRDEQ
jgi:hypothetical protein